MRGALHQAPESLKELVLAIFLLRVCFLSHQQQTHMHSHTEMIKYMRMHTPNSSRLGYMVTKNEQAHRFGAMDVYS
mgnify:CR=1 FL=1